VLCVPPIIYFPKGHVEFLVDADIGQALQSFLSLCPSGVSADADTVFPGKPGLCAVSGKLADAACAVSTLAVAPLISYLLFSASRAEQSTIRQKHFTFDTFHFFLAFPG
jgi:hypothetical protein